MNSMDDLHREVNRIRDEVIQLCDALAEAPVHEEWRTIASRVLASASRLTRALDQESVDLWLLLQNPGRNRQSLQIRTEVDGTLDRILAALSAGSDSRNLSGKVEKIRAASAELSGARALPPPGVSRLRPGASSEDDVDTWSAIVLFATMIHTFVNALLAAPSQRSPLGPRP